MEFLLVAFNQSGFVPFKGMPLPGLFEFEFSYLNFVIYIK